MFLSFSGSLFHSYPLLLLLKALDRKLLFITQPLSCLTFQTVLGRCNALHALPTMLLHFGPKFCVLTFFSIAVAQNKFWLLSYTQLCTLNFYFLEHCILAETVISLRDIFDKIFSPNLRKKWKLFLGIYYHSSEKGGFYLGTWWNVSAKCFKIFFIYGIWKPTYIVFFFHFLCLAQVFVDIDQKEKL